VTNLTEWTEKEKTILKLICKKKMLRWRGTSKKTNLCYEGFLKTRFLFKSTINTHSFKVVYVFEIIIIKKYKFCAVKINHNQKLFKKKVYKQFESLHHTGKLAHSPA